MNKYALLSLSAGVLLAACAPPGGTSLSANLKFYDVQFDPKANPAPGILEIKSPPKGWKHNGKKPGYVGFDAGESGFILLQLKSELLNNTCPSTETTDAAEDAAKWVITKVSLSDEGDLGTEKGTNFGSSVPNTFKEAFPNVILATGELFPGASGGQASTTVTVQNNNAQQGELYVYYEVTAMRCSDKQTVVTDPGWGNGGNGGSGSR